ncbi:hypothetical protein BpJC7_28530 [Weizmannia acidilactici]|uniref:PTS EIIA type-1 domain-containing protein n=1 Tax=Weizmannia acidilactici TaxID=2607726 RepID=A0A5J4JLP1_9BACI|nr:PTS glucose transporter subunit IIA [Weizmannia acidilactici]GER67922.1 hypothetical protein BpJC4_23930 [Weizmannia acidilactici]GER71550.1 hypothetical protein BpJC7_28530 [Weizmannia acidilactici]GER73841.1 hypothetical protein BpPP18_19080 [Weizmannia acidilactici]
MMRNWFKRKNSKIVTLVSPIAGNMIPCKDTGQACKGGIAIQPLEGRVHSPAAGRITHISPENNAISLMTEQGLEITIRLNSEDAAMESEEFVILVKEGDHITVGAPLMEFSFQLTDAKAENIYSSISVSNMDQVESMEVPPAQTIGLDDWVMRIKMKPGNRG